MKNRLFTALITACLMSGTALAKDDCSDPVTDWQPKGHLRQMMENNGWAVKRIKVDDGCYEIKGLDRNGHRVKAKFSPASLKIIELEIKFEGSGDSSDYLDLSNLKSKGKASKKKAKASIE